MVREIKASLVSHASLIRAMTPNLAAAHSTLGYQIYLLTRPSMVSRLYTVCHILITEMCRTDLNNRWKLTLFFYKHFGLHVWTIAFMCEFSHHMLQLVFQIQCEKVHLIVHILQQQGHFCILIEISQRGKYQVKCDNGELEMSHFYISKHTIQNMHV